MKVILAGAFGHLGSDILRELVRQGHEVTAVGRVIRKPADCSEGYTAVAADVRKPETLRGICDGADVLISTVGLTKVSAELSCYDVDYQGNMNLLKEAKRAGVRHFAYVSVLKADSDPTVPMLDAKARFEEKLKKSGIDWVIFRPSGYFFDIAKVFMPMIEKGKVTLLGRKSAHANVVDTPDFAAFIVEHMCDSGKTFNVGGRETWSYEEIARMFFTAAGKKPKISYAPAGLFDLLAWVNRRKKNGKEAIIRFSKWTLTEEMVGDTIVGEASFAAYIKSCYQDRQLPPAEQLLRTLGRRWPLRELDMGEFARINSRGMRFQNRAWDVDGAGRLCLMKMKAFGGLMKMETAVFSLTELDAPLFSMDAIEAMGKSTLFLELYDTTLSHPGFESLGDIKARYAALPDFDPGTHWYESIRLPVSVYKKGKKLHRALETLAADYCEAYVTLLGSCPPCDPNEKKKKNAAFTDGMLQNGGPAVNQFKKMLGEEKTSEFLRKYLFCCV